MSLPHLVTDLAMKMLDIIKDHQKNRPLQEILQWAQDGLKKMVDPDTM